MVSTMNEEPHQMDTEDSPAPQEEEEPFDRQPVFIQPQEAIEVPVDDDDVPMDDDDDDDADPAVVLAATGATAANSSSIDDSHTQFRSHAGPVYAVQARFFLTENNKDNTLVVWSGGGDDRAYRHSTTSESSSSSSSSSSSLQLSHAHTDSVSCLALADDRIAVGAYDGVIGVYSLLLTETGHDGMLFTLEGPTDVEWLCFHDKSSDILMAGSTDGTVWIFHRNQTLQVLAVGNGGGSTAGLFTPKAAITAAADGSCSIWNPKTGARKHRFDCNAALTSLVFHDGMLLTGAENGHAHLLHVATKKAVATLVHGSESVEAVGFCTMSQHSWCATGSVDGVLKIWDTTTNEPSCRHLCRVDETSSNNTAAGITRLQWQEWRVICAYTDGNVRVWDARNGTLLQTVSGGSTIINDICCLVQDQKLHVVTGSDDGIVRVFDIQLDAC